MPSPTACLGSIVKPLSVPAVVPVCSVTDCADSVTPSLSVLLSSEAPLPPPTPIAFKMPETPAVDAAAVQSSHVGSDLPLFLARSIATGPSCCANSNNAGPAIAPPAAPAGYQQLQHLP